MPIHPFVIPFPNQRYNVGPVFGKLEGCKEENDKILLFLQAKTQKGTPYGLIIGYRVNPKREDEKPGDIIQIEVIDPAIRPNMARGFSDTLIGHVIFFE